jgi:hypothetical protein
LERIDDDGFQRVVPYDGKREHDIAFQGRKAGGSQKADFPVSTRGAADSTGYRSRFEERNPDIVRLAKLLPEKRRVRMLGF